MNTRGKIVVSWFAALAGTTACLDMNDVPVTIRAASTDGGVSLADAGVTEDGGIPMSPCNQCIFAEDGICHPDFQTCAANEQCREVVVCAAQLRCLELADFGKVLPCAQLTIGSILRKWGIFGLGTRFWADGQLGFLGEGDVWWSRSGRRAAYEPPRSDGGPSGTAPVRENFISLPDGR